jgi:raffinose/stachyose/melibiose transport system substrate-binding protein
MMKRKIMIKVVSTVCATTMLLSVAMGCSNSKKSDVSGSTDSSKSVTLNYWTWQPSADILNPVITSFEKKYPNIKIKLNVMESTAYQQKIPIALSTGEDIDVIGVQPSAMATSIKSYLADMDTAMSKVDSDWKSKIRSADLTSADKLTGGKSCLLPFVRCGAMVGYYNATLVKKYRLKIPTTIAEFKAFSDQLKAKDPSVMTAAFDGKEGWLLDELMLTVMGQTSSYYNTWRYNGGSVNDSHYINAFNDFKKFFDEGIFSKDVLDMDDAKALELFSTSKAVTYFQGTWDAGLLSESFRKSNDDALTDVGVFALPTVEQNGKGSIRSFIDVTNAIVKSSKNQNAAAKFLAYITFGDGVKLWANNLVGIPCMSNYKYDASIFGTSTEKQGYELINTLVANPTADRNNVSGYSDIEGAAVQKVVGGQAKASDIVVDLQKQWSSGKYGK